MSDKQFIGRVFPGPFASQGTDVKLILRGEDVAALISLGKAAKAAKQQGQPLPAGTKEYEGQIELAIRIRSSQNGKLYAEIDTYVPDPNRQPQQASQPARGQTPTVPPVKQQPKAEAVVVEEDDDLPF